MSRKCMRYRCWRRSFEWNIRAEATTDLLAGVEHHQPDQDDTARARMNTIVDKLRKFIIVAITRWNVLHIFFRRRSPGISHVGDGRHFSCWLWSLSPVVMLMLGYFFGDCNLCDNGNGLGAIYDGIKARWRQHAQMDQCSGGWMGRPKWIKSKQRSTQGILVANGFDIYESLSRVMASMSIFHFTNVRLFVGFWCIDRFRPETRIAGKSIKSIPFHSIQPPKSALTSSSNGHSHHCQ